jgi:hypothetical protein
MPRQRPSTVVYYVAAGILALGLVVGTTLVAMLMTRTPPAGASIEVGEGVPADCPVGGRATACYQFDVTNVGESSGVASCGTSASEGTEALFPNDANTIDVVLASGETTPVFVRVAPLGGDVVSEPVVRCVAD